MHVQSYVTISGDRSINMKPGTIGLAGWLGFNSTCNMNYSTSHH